jgi:hypothetical protein
MDFVRASGLAIRVCVLAECTFHAMPEWRPSANIGSPDTVATVRDTDLSARLATMIDEQCGRSGESPKSLLFPGAETGSPAPASPDRDREQRSNPWSLWRLVTMVSR